MRCGDFPRSDLHLPLSPLALQTLPPPTYAVLRGVYFVVESAQWEGQSAVVVWHSKSLATVLFLCLHAGTREHIVTALTQ